jgi:hypothetical protein
VRCLCRPAGFREPNGILEQNNKVGEDFLSNIETENGETEMLAEKTINVYCIKAAEIWELPALVIGLP